jgi:hypothetical protein
MDAWPVVCLESSAPRRLLWASDGQQALNATGATA